MLQFDEENARRVEVVYMTPELADLRVLPVLNRGYDPDTYSAGLIDIVAGFVSGRQGIEPDEAAAWARDLAGLAGDYFFSLNRYVFVGAAV